VTVVVAHRSIGRVLVANRGEIARRVFRSCRGLGISTVAVFSDADADAVFVREADISVGLGGATPTESYLRATALIDAARRTGADAVHPGYGFLSENADFAEQVLAAGLTWIGPGPDVIRAVGSKIEARHRMHAAAVPILSGRDLDNGTGDETALRAIGAEIGYPVLAKASAGGGGKGMRIVRTPDELSSAVQAARREALSAFGDDTIFLERYVDEPRHVEIQIFGDQHGRVISLFERDCSIQRRHQKVIEEAPSPTVEEELRARMSAAAVVAGESLGYVGAGTVEFLVTPSGEFFFLEVNTRLQVEHAVTELVTGLDLVELQIRIAMGEPLPDAAVHAEIRGHAIEARLYAEDPAQSFLPATGTIQRFSIPGEVRVDTGVESGSEISPHYDPMIAKVIAHGASREEATRRLESALRRAEIHGLVTNRDFLVGVLRSEEFVSGRTDTHFLERNDPAVLGAPLVAGDAERRHAAAAALALQAANRAGATVLRSVPSGWRNNRSQLAATVLHGSAGDRRIEYGFTRDGILERLAIDGDELQGVRLHGCTGESVDLEIDRIRVRYRVSATGAGTVFVNSPAGQAEFSIVPRFPAADEEVAPGSLASPLPGVVIRVVEPAGTDVRRGTPLIIVEAMKMEHEIVAPNDGTLSTVLVAEGDQVEAGTILAVISDPA
jgi:propionyl-CoA carboxylase alpha chain